MDWLPPVRRRNQIPILIAGMGGGIVIHILTEGRKCRKQSAKELDLAAPVRTERGAPLSCVMRAMRSLDEDMVLEDGKYYPMMKVRYVPETNLPQAERSRA